MVVGYHTQPYQCPQWYHTPHSWWTVINLQGHKNDACERRPGFCNSVIGMSNLDIVCVAFMFTFKLDFGSYMGARGMGAH